MVIQPPTKPFPDYKWRWAVYTPTEGLNNPPVFLGVLRTLRKYEGYRPNSPELIAGFGIVQRETQTNVNLSRSGDRNLIRNSGQYWKIFDLLKSTKGGILLSDFGRSVADGKITALEFAATVVKTLVLPNSLILTAEEVTQWGDLWIKPLTLILEILSSLQQQSSQEGYLTPKELYTIIIPLAGERASIEKHTEAIIQYRNATLNLDGWPDCAPESNDKRMAREFLLFLSNYEFCRLDPAPTNEEDKYFLNGLEQSEIEDFRDIDTDGLPVETVYKKIRRSRLTGTVERKKILATIYSRPQQFLFREEVLDAYNSTCMISGATLNVVLEAAHIIPVKNNGQDLLDNGFCLRSDIHRLYDIGHLRIDASGSIYLSNSAAEVNNYGNLPQRITIPAFVSIENVEWRWKYTG